MKLVAWLGGLASLVTALGYMVVSLNRWEWNRALFFGLIVLIAEVGLATGLVLRKLGQLQLAARPMDPDVAAIVRETRPVDPDRFAWLRDTPNRLSVFITFLVGGGVVLSAVAWTIDRIAAHSSTPRGESRLAQRLSEVSYPRGGLLADDASLMAEERPHVEDAALRRLLPGDGRP